MVTFLNGKQWWLCEPHFFTGEVNFMGVAFLLLVECFGLLPVALVFPYALNRQLRS